VHSEVAAADFFPVIDSILIYLEIVALFALSALTLVVGCCLQMTHWNILQRFPMETCGNCGKHTG